jgi:integrase
MPKGYKLTWIASEQRWRKVYKKRELSFPGTGGKLASYQSALSAFYAKKALIDAEDAEAGKRNEAIELIEAEQARLSADYFDCPEVREHWQLLEGSKAYILGKQHLGPDVQWAEAIARIDGYQRTYLQLPKAFVADSRYVPPDPPIGNPPWVEPPKTVDSVVAGFLEERRRAVEIGKLSKARLANQRKHLESFTEFVGASSGIERFDNKSLEEYRALVEGQLARGTMKATYARDRLQAVKQIVNWAYDQELIRELPRCLRKYSIAIETTEPETIPKEQIAKLYASANDQQKLYLLLGLNCGFTSSDIANLAISEVDIEAGTITRKRSKTKKAKSVPTVVYFLWSETWALVAKHLQKTGSLAFLTERGKPLIQQALTDSHELKKTDTIHSSWVRLQKVSGVKQSHRYLRKTGASILYSNNQFARFHGMFLGHAPQGVAERHYLKPDREGFREALVWLRDQFELPSILVEQQSDHPGAVTPVAPANPP